MSSARRVAGVAMMGVVAAACANRPPGSAVVSLDAPPPSAPVFVGSLALKSRPTRPPLVGVEVALGPTLTTGERRVTYDVPAEALSWSSCTRRAAAVTSLRITGCVGSVVQADALTSWANTVNERALMECVGYREVSVKAVTAARDAAKVADGSAAITPQGQHVIAGAWLGKNVYPEDSPFGALYQGVPRTPAPLGPENIQRSEEHFVVDEQGVLHLARLLVREDRNVGAKICGCPVCGGSGVGRPPPRFDMTQTWYAIPEDVRIGAPVAFAPDYAYIYVSQEVPPGCKPCPIPA